MTKIYIIRHCAATGQEPDAELTETGMAQAVELGGFLSETGIERIVSSPYARAVQSIGPLAEALAVEIETDERLKERVLSSGNLPDWFELLKSTFDDHDLTLEGGESSRLALSRISQVVGELENSGCQTAAIVTHGNIMALLLSRYMEGFGFEGWRALSNPDVFVLNDGVDGKRLWHEETQ
ncbi:histidine phosphatase family protein [Planococcus sp. CP5-4]|uniref:histidine phosphatase family protein n=1 Tax=unclassified Planococcus (in: firmicutes) TaxID=2662419 RepID=UPI001C23AE82|nr:histidine phosphatase family protein [Planococcus sp. CP5-4]MBU9673645.1 histidine phosphatase family protein [Planococcus sp. CP5-4_YE]MBV0907935.1 histidine phosphatase family protein [Planococcus sp. CP5-4_UN]MBW6063102.1 histidine phosphatase family protein [Planococcus sp. CP5-4]